MKFKQTVLLGAAMAGLLASSAASAAEEQFIGLPSYRVGPYAAGGVGIEVTEAIGIVVHIAVHALVGVHGGHGHQHHAAQPG